jgi:hypothetical protein
MGEIEGFGVPLAYCLLDTAQSIAAHKRRRALASFLAAMHDRYNLNPDIVHTDKDFAEIGAAHDTWLHAKHQLCYWHLREAVRKRMAQSKLSTAPYHLFEANAEFGFIDLGFLPRTKPDTADVDAEKRTAPPPQYHIPGPVNPPTRLPPIRLPPTQQATQALSLPTSIPPLNTPPTNSSSSERRIIHLGRIKLLCAISPAAELDASDAAHVPEPDLKRSAVFCPESARNGVVARMERHFCVHPQLPGSCAPNAEDIRFWAVKDMYMYCHTNNLPELWAYLWEGWYHCSRWALWARSAGKLVPRLKTTMLCESQSVYLLFANSVSNRVYSWRRIKKDFLKHFHKPRLDILIWVLVEKLAPTYMPKLDALVTNTRHCH